MVGVRVYMIFCSYTGGALETLGLLPLGSETRNQKSVYEFLGMPNSTFVSLGALEQGLPAVEIFGFSSFLSSRNIIQY